MRCTFVLKRFLKVPYDSSTSKHMLQHIFINEVPYSLLQLSNSKTERAHNLNQHLFLFFYCENHLIRHISWLHVALLKLQGCWAMNTKQIWILLWLISFTWLELY